MDNLRLILFILGILVIAAIYAWEIFRGRRANARREPEQYKASNVFDSAFSPEEHGVPTDPSASPNIPKDESDTDKQYWDRLVAETDDKVALGNLDILDNIKPESPPSIPASDDSPPPPAKKPESGEKLGFPEKFEPAGLASEPPKKAEPMEKLAPMGKVDVADTATARRIEAEEHHSFVDRFRIKKHRVRKLDLKKNHGGKGASEKELFIALTIIAHPGRQFGGIEIRDQFEKIDMHLGHMEIFHHFGMADQQTEHPVFSAADIFEPGVFYPDEIENHATKGLVLFMQLPGPLDGRVAFELMLNVAQQLAKSLDGELCDDTRSTLTTQSVNHLRERIEELKRKQLI
uniref:Cell division protein ZipA n=1 Tax=Candidatus Kentrum sp. SD TaxID=2126332 RepID=A0A451BKL8_9GAMM|nr:MAG: cell division protein ZipA [Candidatus Kentron sp. SD]